jgi:hypothetical protein
MGRIDLLVPFLAFLYSTQIVDMDSKTVIRIDLPHKGPTVEWNKEDNNYREWLFRLLTLMLESCSAATSV